MMVNICGYEVFLQLVQRIGVRNIVRNHTLAVKPEVQAKAEASLEWLPCVAIYFVGSSIGYRAAVG